MNEDLMDRLRVAMVPAYIDKIKRGVISEDDIEKLNNRLMKIIHVEDKDK